MIKIKRHRLERSQHVTPKRFAVRGDDARQVYSDTSRLELVKWCRDNDVPVEWISSNDIPHVTILGERARKMNATVDAMEFGRDVHNWDEAIFASLIEEIPSSNESFYLFLKSNKVIRLGAI